MICEVPVEEASATRRCIHLIEAASSWNIFSFKRLSYPTDFYITPPAQLTAGTTSGVFFKFGSLNRSLPAANSSNVESSLAGVAGIPTKVPGSNTAVPFISDLLLNHPLGKTTEIDKAFLFAQLARKPLPQSFFKVKASTRIAAGYQEMQKHRLIWQAVCSQQNIIITTITGIQRHSTELLTSNLYATDQMFDIQGDHRYLNLRF